MLLAGLAVAACLDPWFFSVETASQFAESLRPAARHAQGVVIGMGLLQLAMAHLLATPSFEHRVRQVAAILTSLAHVSTRPAMDWDCFGLASTGWFWSAA